MTRISTDPKEDLEILDLALIFLKEILDVLGWIFLIPAWQK